MARITSINSTKTEKRLGTLCLAIFFLLSGLCFGQAAGSPSPSGGRPKTHVPPIGTNSTGGICTASTPMSGF